MKLFPLATNQTVIELANGTEIFFSYKTPVAAFVPGTGYIRTTEKFSRTTSKHINQWLRGYAASDVDQSVIENLVGGA